MKLTAPLTYEKLTTYFEQESSSISAIVELIELRGVQYVVLYAKNEARYGGVRWVNAPQDKVKERLLEAQQNGQSLQVEMDTKIEPFSAEYGINPMVDPVAIITNLSEPKYELVAQVDYPEEEAPTEP
ncbi:MAG: hypothetical protein ACSHX0_07875 [Akkermansiaceae bacterium]